MTTKTIGGAGDEKEVDRHGSVIGWAGVVRDIRLQQTAGIGI